VSKKKTTFYSKALVSYSYNPSYSGGRDQENCGLKPAQANSFERRYLKKTLHNKELAEWLKV
jgi:hypothetical protein